jgi:hypothetical protein
MAEQSACHIRRPGSRGTFLSPSCLTVCAVIMDNRRASMSTDRSPPARQRARTASGPRSTPAGTCAPTSVAPRVPALSPGRTSRPTPGTRVAARLPTRQPFPAGRRLLVIMTKSRQRARQGVHAPPDRKASPPPSRVRHPPRRLGRVPECRISRRHGVRSRGADHGDPANGWVHLRAAGGVDLQARRDDRSSS